MEGSENFVNCLRAVKGSLDTLLAEQFWQFVNQEHDLSETEVADVFRITLVRIAVEACAKNAPNITDEEVNQLELHVNHLLHGAVSSAIDRAKQELEDNTDG